MTYKILNTKVVGEHISTEVEYNFDGTVVLVDIFHFMPETQSEIEQNILNRAYSEKRKLDAIALNETLINQIPLNEEKPIN
jgi:hypothetical protein